MTGSETRGRRSNNFASWSLLALATISSSMAMASGLRINLRQAIANMVPAVAAPSTDSAQIVVVPGPTTTVGAVASQPSAPSTDTSNAALAPLPTTKSKPVVVSEGDSISVFFAASHTGIYAAATPSVTFKGFAVGGSGIDAVIKRQQAVIDARPNVFTILIGANDLPWGATTNGGPLNDEIWLNRLLTYTDAVRRTGAKVAVATILPKGLPGWEGHNRDFNATRNWMNGQIRQAYITHRIDAVIDFASDPVIGPDAAGMDRAIFGDGLHPGEVGQARMATIYKKAVDSLLEGS